MKANKFMPLFNPNGIVSFSPGLRGTSYPGNDADKINNPNGVVTVIFARCRNPVGVETILVSATQGSRSAPTLGFAPESLWDSEAAAHHLNVTVVSVISCTIS